MRSDAITQDIKHLVTDYINGRLSIEDIQRVEAAAALDDTFAAEIAFERNLQAATPHVSPDIGGWDRLQAAMADSPDLPAAPADNIVTFEPARSAAQSDIANAAVNDRAGFVSSRWRIAAVALGVAALGQTAIFGALSTDDARYTVVSDTAPATGSTVQLSFEPTSTVADIQGVLRDAKAQITAGPSALGLYNIRFETAEQCETAHIGLAQTETVTTLMSCR